jgi:hypothetical protein
MPDSFLKAVISVRQKETDTAQCPKYAQGAQCLYINTRQVSLLLRKST